MRTNDFIGEGLALAYRLGLWTPELGTLAHYYRLGQLSHTQRELLERLVAPAHAIARQHPELALFDTPASHDGELLVGTLPHGKPFRLKLAQLALGTIICGSTGSGKTTLLRILALALFRHLNTLPAPSGVWLVDHQKADLETTIALAEKVGLKICTATPDLPINPLAPPSGVAPRVWAVKALSILAFALQLSEIAVLHIRPILNDLYARESRPTWLELIEAVKTAPGMLEAVRKPLVLKMEGIAADLPSIANTRNGVPIEELERRLIYFPLYRLPLDHARLIFAWARWASFSRRLEKRLQHTTPNLFIIEDEIGFAYNATSGNDFISMLCAVQRSSGIAFIGANQTFELLPQILANCNTKLIGRLANMPDIRTASDALVLTPEQRDWLLTQPRPGQFIAKLPSGHLQPFPFQGLDTPPMEVSSRDRAEAENRLFEELHLQRNSPDEQEKSEAPEPRIKKPAARPEAGSTNPSAKTEKREVVLKGDELIVLKNCHEQPFLFMRDRATACGLTRHRLTRAKDELVTRALLVEHELETCLPGARPKLCEITPAGCEALCVPAKPWAGREGRFLHVFGKDLASRYYLEQAFQVQVEVPLGGGLAADVVATDGNIRVAIEVQLGIDHATENLAKLRDRFDRVEFMCFDAPTRNRLQRQLGAAATVNHISFYINKLRHSQSGKDLLTPGEE